MAGDAPTSDRGDMATVIALLTKTIERQSSFFEEVRQSQAQMVSMLSARMDTIESSVQGLTAGNGFRSSASSSGANSVGVVEAVAGLSPTSEVASVNGTPRVTAESSGTSTPNESNTRPDYKGKGKPTGLLEAIRARKQTPAAACSSTSQVSSSRQATAPSEPKSIPVSTASQYASLPTPPSVHAGTEKPLSTYSFGSSLDDAPVTPSTGSPPKRKRKINQPRAAPVPTLNSTERPVSSRKLPSPTSTSAASTSSIPFAGSKQKNEENEDIKADSRPPICASRPNRLYVLMNADAAIRKRMRVARPMREVLDDLDDKFRPASSIDTDLYSEVFGSSDLSDLTDSEEEEEEEEESDAEDETISTERDSEIEVESQVQMVVDSDDPMDGEAEWQEEEQPTGRHARRNVPKPNYVPYQGDLADWNFSPPIDQGDEHSDYRPDDSDDNSAPGPSSRPYRSRVLVSSSPPAAGAFEARSFAGTVVGARERQATKSEHSPDISHSVSASNDHRPSVAIKQSSFPEHDDAEARLPSKSQSVAGPSTEKPLSAKKKTVPPPPRSIIPSTKPKAETKASPPLRLRSEVKQDKPQMQLIPPAGIRRRLDGYTPREVKLEPEVRNVLVTRKFMSETYGGSPQPLYPTISNAKRMALGGHQHRFVYPTLKRNPEVPLIPGSVGLLCRALSEVPWGPLEVKLVVGIGEAMWAYMGNYTTTKTESLSKEEWNSLSDHTKQVWAKDIATRDKYVPLRTRIYLRELYGREPTEIEVEDQSQIVKSETSEPTDEQLRQIQDAYSVGHEEIHIWYFKCVGYDEDFQRELVEKFKSFVPKKRRNSDQLDDLQPPAKKPRGRPRKQPAPLAAENKPPSQRQSKFTITAVSPPTKAKTLKAWKRKLSTTTASNAAEPGHLLSPPVTPQSSPSPTTSSSQSQDKRDENGDKDDDILAGLRESWSAGRDSGIPDVELASLLYDRRHGIHDLRRDRGITEGDYMKVKNFSAQHGYEWD